ncbi:MAG: diguanylate cyclase [Gammaproteobacteria bacterium]|jgi:diguanylate cyclase (GGDEF)-like protein
MAAAAEKTSRLGDAVLRQALDLICEGLLVLGVTEETAEIHYANSQFTRLSGFTLEELATMSWQDICQDICMQDVAAMLQKQGSYCGTLLMERADGTRWRSGVRVRALLEESGGTATWLAQFMPAVFLDNGESDFLSVWLDSDLPNARSRFGRLDRIDGSSGLLRFDRFREFLERDLSLAAREARPATIILLKILEFEQYRCTFGVNASDSCLRTVGKQVTAALRRSTDLCARLNDDTIIAAIVGRTSDDAGRLAGQISENVRALRIHNPRGRFGRFLSLSYIVSPCNPVTRDLSVDKMLEAAMLELDRISDQTLTA